MLRNLMSQKTRRRKLILTVLAVLTLVSLCFIAFHHHDAQDSHVHDCLVCLAVRTLVYFLICDAVILLGGLLPKISFRSFSETFTSRLTCPVLRDRAPPTFA